MPVSRKDEKGEPPPAGPVQTSLAGRIRAARESKGWTREALAYHAGVSWAAIAQIESGRRADIRLRTLEALSSALGVSLDHLLGRDPDGPTLEHSAMIYRTTDEFVHELEPFFRKGAERGYALIAVTTADKIKALRRALGSDASSVEFIESDSWYLEPYPTLEAFRATIDERIAAGYEWVRAIGEPIWIGRSRDEIRRWIRYEAFANLALTSCRATIICPYDATALPSPVVDGAYRTHPQMQGARRRNAKFREPAEFLLSEDPPA